MLVKLDARAVRQNRGVKFQPIYKFASDSNNGTVYVLAIDEEDANMMAGHSFEWQVKECLSTMLSTSIFNLNKKTSTRVLMLIGFLAFYLV